MCVTIKEAVRGFADCLLCLRLFNGIIKIQKAAYMKGKTSGII